MANGVGKRDSCAAISNPFTYVFCVAFRLTGADRSAYRYRCAAACDQYAAAAHLYTCTGDTDEPATSDCDP